MSFFVRRSFNLLTSSPINPDNAIRFENVTPNGRSFMSSQNVRMPSKVMGSDSKDLVIAQLKREIMEEKISDKDYNNISSQLTNLERRYTELKQEKNIKEMEFSHKMDHQMKTYANLQTEFDTFVIEIYEKDSEFKNLL